MMTEGRFLELVRSVNVWRAKGERAPHKPLLLLLALGRAQRDVDRLVPFAEVEKKLRRLLLDYGPTRRSYHPEYPFWRLQNDEIAGDSLWEVPGGDVLRTRASNTDPPITELRKVTGGFTEETHVLLRQEPELIGRAARILLDDHFQPSFEQDILADVGLSLGEPDEELPSRDPAFRSAVLAAYGYQCAVCDYAVALDGLVVGLESAHYRWHKRGGPCTVDNGLALCPSHHKALDLGLLGLDLDHRLIVSSRLNKPGVAQFEPFLGRVVVPQSGDPIAGEHIEWHQREVFKAPAL